MCDPVSIGSALLTVAGTGLQMKAQKDARKQTQRVLSANAEKQMKLRQDSSQKLAEAASGFEREQFDENQDAATQAIAQKFSAGTADGALPGEYAGPATSANTQKYALDKKSENDAYIQKYQEALAKMRGFGTNMTNKRLNTGRAGEQMQLNAAYMQGNEAVLPIQLQAAQNASSSPLGDIFAGIGQAGLTAGLSAKLPGGTPPFVPGQAGQASILTGQKTQAAADAVAKKAGIVWK